MCSRALASFALLSVASFLMGCQQTTGTNSSLTPIAPYSATNQLSPIQPSSGVGPMGGSTRVPPPPTGGFSVPNNYMGGVAPNGQASQYQPSANGFASTPAQPTGWVQSGTLNPQTNSTTFNTGTFNNANAVAANAPASVGNPIQGNVMRPQSGGMRVIDLTNAPPPPGYRSQGGFVSQGNFGPNLMNNSGVAPAGYVPSFGSTGNAPIAAFPQGGTVFRPDTSNGTLPNSPVIGQRFESTASTPSALTSEPSAAIQRVPLKPTSDGVSRPSTDPVNDELSWRRPTIR